MGGLHCRVSPTLLNKVSRNKVVEDEFLRLLGCKDEPSAQTAARWSGFFRQMAVQMNLTNSEGESHLSHMVIDAGYNDNSGLGPILADYLESESDQGQILVLVINQLGDHQMETYFNTSGNNGGMMCENERTDAKMDEVFRTMDAIHQNSFQAIGGEYIKQEHESTCAIRLPRTLFFEDKPPQHHRFEDKKIPAHMTYAYKKGATIARNDEFYTLPAGKTKEIDLLFVIASAPVATTSLPEAGSGPYLGLAHAMELAMNELSNEFPEFVGEKNTLRTC